MKVALSGGNGFIGNTLLQSLSDVVSIPRKYLYSTKLLYSFFKTYRPTHIFHFAAYGNHSHQTNWDLAYHANVEVLHNLLKVTRDYPYEAFINIGSSSEYGAKSEPMHESDCPSPRTAYEGTKAAGTMLAQAFARSENKPIVTVRPFSVYGKGEAAHRFIPTVIRAIVQNESLQLYPEGRHDWIHIDDFLNGVMYVVSHIKQLQGEIINIGTGIETTNQDIVNMLLSIADTRQLQVTLTDKLSGHDSARWVADNTQLLSLGWEAEYTLEEGLEEVYGYYKDKYK